MSSHHIVRDQQEPALIVADINKFPLKILEELLGWSPTVVCLGQSVDQYAEYGLKLDHFIIESSRVDEYTQKLSYQWPFHIHEKEEDDMSQAISILENAGHTTINIITSANRISDLAYDFMSYEKLAFSFFSENAKGLFHTKNKFAKWLPKGTTMQVQPLHDDSVFTTKGFSEYLIEHQKSTLFTVESVSDGQVQITSSKVPYLIFEKY